MLPLLILTACSPDWPVWRPGDLLIEQIALDSLAIGQATLVVGPDGTAVLIDVGNDRHANDVIEALDRHLGETRLDHVILTHTHADHVGGFDRLFGPSRANDHDPITIDGTVISRGPVDLDPGAANRSEYRDVCETIDDQRLSAWDLCFTDDPAPCDIKDDGGPWPATDCDGLLDASIDLGEGAWLDIVAANGTVLTNEGLTSADIDHDNHASENARSLVGTITWGDFRYVWGGDLAGPGEDTTDMEAFVAEHASDALLDVADVVLLNHHGIKGSTGDDWLDRLLPDDGSDRNAIVGNTSAYIASPSGEVLDRVGPRLGDGAVWALVGGLKAPFHGDLVTARGPVVVRITDDGTRYWLGDDRGGDSWQSHSATATRESQ